MNTMCDCDCACEAQKSPEISLSLERIKREIKELQEAVNLIRGKFVPVLRNNNGQCLGKLENTKDAAIDTRSPLRKELDSVADQIEAVTSDLFAIKERCEL